MRTSYLLSRALFYLFILKIWSTTTKVIEAHSDSVTSVAVSSDDEKIASASVDKTVKVNELSVSEEP